MLTTAHIRNWFIGELHDERFIIDRTGVRTIEMIGASFVADEPAIFGVPNLDYIERELDWYDSMSTNINDLSNPPPKAWEYSANEHGEINSNYGLLIYGDEYFCQYDRVLDELVSNPNSRRACAIYNRPSIHVEAFTNGKNDFICTNAVSYYIRDNQLHCVVQMRSNDVIFGYRNDYAWQREVQLRLVEDLNAARDRMFEEPIDVGTMVWQVQNLHVYERHFDLVE
jgi:thymidylate synthase